MKYQKILKNLSESDSKYLVVGGMALLFSGYRRLTMDLDILADLKTENLEKIVKVMDDNGYIPRVPVNAKDILDESKRLERFEEKGMKAFTYVHPEDPLSSVDLLIFNPISFENAYENKRELLIENTPVYFASIDDLISMKKVAGRTKDLYDIKMLEIIKERAEDE